MSEISFHCSGLGSTPVGLWAQACNKITLFSGIACHKKQKQKKGVVSKNWSWKANGPGYMKMLLSSPAAIISILQRCHQELP